MLRTVRRLAATLAVVGLILSAASGAFAESRIGMGSLENETAPPMVDLILMRPLGLAGLAVSAAVWVPAQAATMLFRPSEWRAPIDHMLVKPYEFVFVDPLGLKSFRCTKPLNALGGSGAKSRHSPQSPRRSRHCRRNRDAQRRPSWAGHRRWGRAATRRS